jgi:hypothetical protein
MKINKLTVGLVLFFTLGLLTLVHILLVITNSHDYELLSLFRMDYESSLLTWYSQTVLLFIPAVLAAYIGFGKRQAGAPFAKHWFLLSGLLVFLSIDDGAMIHEKFSFILEVVSLQALLNTISAEWFAWSWWVVYAAVFVAIAAFFAKWFLSLPNRSKWLLGLAVFLMIFGQIGLEAVTGFLNANGNYDIILRGFEKLIGRSGLAVLFIALLDYIQFLPKKQRPKIELDIS